MATPSNNIAAGTQFKEYTAFPVVEATFVTDLGGAPNALLVVAAGTLATKQLDGTARTFTAIAAGQYLPMQVSEITSATGGKVIAFRSGV